MCVIEGRPTVDGRREERDRQWRTDVCHSCHSVRPRKQSPSFSTLSGPAHQLLPFSPILSLSPESSCLSGPLSVLASASRSALLHRLCTPSPTAWNALLSDLHLAASLLFRTLPYTHSTFGERASPLCKLAHGEV